MQKLKVELDNCYGITHLDHEFDFGPYGPMAVLGHSQTNIVYARNGVMKTSFAKTFKAISQGEEPKELVYGSAARARIEVDGEPICPSSIFVVESQGNYFESETMVNLLADKASQLEYAAIINEIEAASQALFNRVNKYLRFRSNNDVLGCFDAAFGSNATNRLQKIISMKNDVNKANLDYLRADYRVLSDPKVTSFLNKPENHQILKTYFETYRRVLEASSYFKDGLFDYTNALNVQATLAKNMFMEADNKVILSDGIEVTDAKALKKLYEEDKNRIFENLDLKKQYETFDNAIQGNVQLRDFRTFAKANQDLVPYLQQQDLFLRQIWYAYFAEADGLFNALVSSYETHRERLLDLYRKSDDAQTKWQQIVDNFNKAFPTPFKVVIVNKRDVILNQSKPMLAFRFKGPGKSDKPIDEYLLRNDILSTGELRALYILCVMFEIESRIKPGSEHLIVIDDIADSFDYKNKYAIVEYLHRLSKDHANGIHMIILTHNFDFYRCMRLRCWSKERCKTQIAQRDNITGSITLTEGKSISEFDNFKQIAHRDNAVFLAMVPFARNLIEYARTTADTDYDKLTEALHFKTGTLSLTCNDIASAVSGVVTTTAPLTNYSNQNSYYDFLVAEAGIIALGGDETKLEHKIVLSMAARMLAEAYMLKRFTTDNKTLPDSSHKQTQDWFEKFEDEYSRTDRAYDTLRLVILMTPEAIHINSFMYEPIMDMSLNELVGLYKAVCTLE